MDVNVVVPPTVTEQPAEYCLMWINHWATCMPRAEWSAWTQAVGAVVALAIALWIAWWQAALLRRTQQHHAQVLIDAALGAIEHHAHQLAQLTNSQSVVIDSKFLRNAAPPFDGLMGAPLPKRIVKNLWASRQLLLTFADCVDTWTGRPVARCADLKPTLDFTLEQVRAIRQGPR